MVETATGLVLRIRPLTETSQIVHWITSEFGRLATVAKGARRPKSPFRGKLDLFYLADFSFRRSRTSELHNLHEVNVVETHAFLRRELGYLQQASYCVRLIEQATETDTPLASLFEMFRGFLEALAAQPCRSQMVFAFELRLLAELGLQPDSSLTRLSEGAKALVRRFQGLDWSATQCLRLNQSQQSELRHFLHGFLLYHLGRIPKGRDIALDPSRTL